MSDPGSRLVASAQAAGAPYEVLPGASAAATAYVASGFSDPRYYFGGFFPRKAGERKAVLEALSSLDASLVFYESPRRIADALAVIAEVFPAREVAVCRELTKRHEEVFRAMAPIAAEEFGRRDAEEGVKGEIALVICPPTAAEVEDNAAAQAASAAERATELLASGEMSHKDIVAALRRRIWHFAQRGVCACARTLESLARGCCESAALARGEEGPVWWLPMPVSVIVSKGGSMNDFVFYSPTEFIFGKGVTDQVASILPAP